MARKTIEGEAVELSPEAAADWERLEARAQEGQQAEGAAPVEAEQEPAPSMTPEQSLAGLMQLAAMIVEISGFKRVAGVWTETVCTQFAEKAVPVLKKYTWGRKLLAFLDDGAGVEEIAFLLYLAQLVVMTIGAAKADIKAMREAEKEKDMAQEHENQ
jgi:hypothetical protein